jgi:hypothetical protein
VNAAPTDVLLSNNSIAENSVSGTVVGTLSTSDPDAGDTHTYSLVSGTGALDNGSFTIDGGSLKTAAVFDFETKSSYSIRVRTTDAVGLTFERAITVSVTNVKEVTGFDVQRGQKQRSFVRYIDVVLDSNEQLPASQIRMRRFDLNGNNAEAVDLALGTAQSVVSTSGNRLLFDFGSNGIGVNAGGRNRNTNAGDGYYRVEFDLDADGTFETERRFYRLLGYVNSDRVVDDTDFTLIQSAFGTNNQERDVNGDGWVNSLDRTLAIRNRNRRFAESLGIDD